MHQHSTSSVVPNILCYIVTCYIQNAGQKLERLNWKVDSFNASLTTHIALLQTKKSVIWCGDLVYFFVISHADPAE